MATDYFNLMRDVVGSYGKGVEIARDRQYQDEKRAREKTLQERDDANYARTQEDRTNVDTALKSFQATQGGIYDGRQAKFDTPMTEGEMGPQMQSAMPNPAAGLTPRAPTKLETNQGLAGIAMAQRDVNAMGTLAQQAGVLRIDQKFGDALKAYKNDPDQVNSTIEYLNDSSGKITMGDPDKNGLIRMMVVKPDKRAEYMKLSRQDQAQLYAAGTIMEDDPARALEIIGGVNKTLAAAVAAENGLTKFLGDNNNDVTAKGATMVNDKTRLGLEQQRVGIAAGAASAAKQNLREYVDAKGQSVLVDVSALPKGEGGVLRLPPGLRPKTARGDGSLSETQKIAYGQAVKELADLGPDAPETAAAAVYRKYGLDPAQFGVIGRPGWGEDASVTNKATTEGRALLDLYNTVVPPTPTPQVRRESQSQAERLRGLYIGGQ